MHLLSRLQHQRLKLPFELTARPIATVVWTEPDLDVRSFVLPEQPGNTVFCVGIVIFLHLWVRHHLVSLRLFDLEFLGGTRSPLTAAGRTTRLAYN